MYSPQHAGDESLLLAALCCVDRRCDPGALAGSASGGDGLRYSQPDSDLRESISVHDPTQTDAIRHA